MSAIETSHSIFENTSIILNDQLPYELRTIRKVKTVSWDSLASASATYNVYVSSSTSSSWGSLWVNGVKVQDFDFRFGGGTLTGTVNVALTPGNNEFIVKVEHYFSVGPWVVTIILNTNGVNVRVYDSFFDDLPTWWPYVAAGGVLAVALAYAWRKRQARVAQYKRRNS